MINKSRNHMCMLLMFDVPMCGCMLGKCCCSEFRMTHVLKISGQVDHLQVFVLRRNIYVCLVFQDRWVFSYLDLISPAASSPEFQDCQFSLA